MVKKKPIEDHPNYSLPDHHFIPPQHLVIHPARKHHPHKHPYRNLTLVAIVLLLLSILLYVKATRDFEKTFPKKMSENATQQMVKQSTPIPTPGLDITWNIHKNSEYHYQITYPDNWNIGKSISVDEPSFGKKIHGTDFSSSLDGYNFFRINVYSNPKRYTLDEWAKNFKLGIAANPDANRVKVLGDVVLDGKQAKEFSIFHFAYPGDKAIATLYNGSIYYIVFPDIDPTIHTTESYDDQTFLEQKQIYEVMLASFKFLE